MSTRAGRRRTPEAIESEGLAFLKRIAEVVCRECEVTHTLVEERGTCVITVTGNDDVVKFYFNQAEFEDMDCEKFRVGAMKFLEHFLKTFRARSVH